MFFSSENRNLYLRTYIAYICASYHFFKNLFKLLRIFTVSSDLILIAPLLKDLTPKQFFFYLHIYLLISYIYSSFSSTFFTDISSGSVGVLVNGESHVSVSQVSEVTTFNEFLSEFDLMVPFASRFRFFRTSCLLLLL